MKNQFDISHDITSTDEVQVLSVFEESVNLGRLMQTVGDEGFTLVSTNAKAINPSSLIVGQSEACKVLKTLYYGASKVKAMRVAELKKTQTSLF